MKLNNSQDLRSDLESVLISEEDLQKKVRELGAAISRDYEGKELVLVGILRGALVFLSDLTRSITIPHSFDMCGASSYGGALSSSGHVQITKDVEVNLYNKHVVICEDIYDSGRTLAAIADLLRLHRPASVEMCAFLWKKVPKRYAELEIKYKGFEIDDVFVVGYGLDYQELYRNLPMIGVLSPKVYREDGDH